MKTWHAAVLGLMIGFIGSTWGQSSAPDRGKVGTDLSTALNGTDTYVLSVVANDDGGTTIPACAYVGTGFNIMVWCDEASYVVNSRTSPPLAVDGGLMRTQEMVPINAYEKYPMGLFGNNKGYGCVWGVGRTSDGGALRTCNFDRRY